MWGITGKINSRKDKLTTDKATHRVTTQEEHTRGDINEGRGDNRKSEKNKPNERKQNKHRHTSQCLMETSKKRRSMIVQNISHLFLFLTMWLNRLGL